VSPGQPVRFFQSITLNQSATICAGDSYPIGNQILTQSGVYTIPLPTSSGCDSIVQLTLDVRQPALTLGPDQTICVGDAAQLNAQTTGCTGCQFAWSTPGLSGKTVTVKPAASTTYTVTITDNASCTAQDTVYLQVSPPANITLEVAICAGSMYTVGNQAFSQAGQFTVHLSSAAGCDSTVLLRLDVLEPRAYGAATDTFFYPPGLGASDRAFDPVANDTVPDEDAWIARLITQPGAGTAEMDSTGRLLYRLQNTAFLGIDSFWYEICDRTCTGTCVRAPIRIVVQDKLPDLASELPNGLTPNGDGFNDTFDPVQYFLDKNYIVPNSRATLTVLNRWGEIVFHAGPYPDGGWDGRSSSGHLMAQGAYYYLLRLDLGETVKVKGVVHVLGPNE